MKGRMQVSKKGSEAAALTRVHSGPIRSVKVNALENLPLCSHVIDVLEILQSGLDGKSPQ